MTGHTLYLILVPAGIVIGHIGIAAKILPKIVLLDTTSCWLARLWCILVLICWVVRVQRLGTVVTQGPYDTALSLALVTTILAVLWEIFTRRKVPLAPLASLVSAALMGRGRAYAPAAELTSFDPAWIVNVHAILAYFAFGMLALNSFFALRLILGRGEKPPELGRWFGITLTFGFFSYSAMVLSGSLSSISVRKTIWNFDPIEWMAVAVWLILGALLLIQRSGRWPEKRIAVIGFVFFFFVVLSFRLVDYLQPGSSFHVFPNHIVR